ncbi:cell division protein FtsA [Chloroflexota bacterium]
MERILTSIDVGTSKVCTTTALMKDGDIIKVLGSGIVPSRGIHKAIVRDIAEPTAAIRDSVKEAERTSNTAVRAAYAGITGHHIGSINNRAMVEVARRDHRITQEDVDRALERSRRVSLSRDIKIIHAIPRQYYVDGETLIGNPVGLHGFRLEVETCLITAGVSFVQNLVKCIQGAGIDVLDLILEPIASAEAVLEEDERRRGVVIGDIGAGTTDITVFKNGAIWYNAALPVGGYNVTKDIAVKFGLPFKVAEELKVQYGSVMSKIDKNLEIDRPGSRGNYGINYKEFCYIIEARIEEIIRMLFTNLPRSEWEAWEPNTLVLCGGTANLPGIDMLAKEILDMSVRVGKPKNMPEEAAILDNPAYATGIGMLLWGTRYGTSRVTTTESLLRRFFFQLRRLRLPRIRIDFGN